MVESDAKHGWYLRGHGAVAGAFERLIAAQCFAAFFTSGRLMSKADAFRFNNSEYLSGTIAFAQVLCCWGKLPRRHTQTYARTRVRALPTP